MTKTQCDIETVLNAYIECALWSSYEISEGGDTLYTYDELESELASSTIDAMRAEVTEFISGCETDRPNVFDGISDEQIGHDFWLTRNGHGAGFWDRGLGERGDWLTKQTEGYGTSDLGVNADGKIVAS